MSSVITTDFERWKAQEAALGKPVALNEFVFAYVPGLDLSEDISRDEKLPPDAQIVHRQGVSKTGLASENAVVYSVTLGTDTGDFVFNWIGLINKESGTLAMITHVPEQRKFRTVDGITGNVIIRSFLLEFNGAAKETAITTSAETWQIDFTARLTGIDEIQRLANRDIYGAATFFGDGFLVTSADGQYRITPGTAYIEGLRGTLEDIITFNHLRDTKIYADFTFQGNLVSQWQTFVNVTAAETLAHYQDAAGFQHYVAVIAEVDKNGDITDKRVKGTEVERDLKTQVEKLSENKLDKTDIVQTTGDSAEKVMSQNAVTEAIKNIKIPEVSDATTDRKGIVQLDNEISDSETKVPSSKLIKTALADKPSTASMTLEMNKKINKSDITHQLGNDSTKVASQQLVTTELGKKAAAGSSWSKAESDNKYQPKGDYALKSDLSEYQKKTLLVSGIKQLYKGENLNTGSTFTASEDLRGRMLYMQSTMERGFTPIVIPQDNMTISACVTNDSWYEIRLTNNGRTFNVMNRKGGVLVTMVFVSV